MSPTNFHFKVMLLLLQRTDYCCVKVRVYRVDHHACSSMMNITAGNRSFLVVLAFKLFSLHSLYRQFFIYLSKTYAEHTMGAGETTNTLQGINALKGLKRVLISGVRVRTERFKIKSVNSVTSLGG